MYSFRQVCEFKVLEWRELGKGDRDLLFAAITARTLAIAPITGFLVGAAMRSAGQRRGFYPGYNMEEYTLNGSQHAEDMALIAMKLALGPDAKWLTLALALGPKTQIIIAPPMREGKKISYLRQIAYSPCGHCRTVLSQHTIAPERARVLMLQPNGQVVVTTMYDLYPVGFNF